MSKKITRAGDSCSRILGSTASSEDLIISGCRLPTYKQVILCYIANRNKLKSAFSNHFNNNTAM